MKVLVLGASGASIPPTHSRSLASKFLIRGQHQLTRAGFIGRPVADAFVRAGHIVYGQTRSTETARELAKDEIIPVVCDPMTEEGGAIWAKVAGQADVGEPSACSCAPLNAIRGRSRR